jgi:predicted PurR-regulated permease PerM
MQRSEYDALSQRPDNDLALRAEYASLALMALAALLMFPFRLVPAMFAGMLVYTLVHLLAPHLFGLKSRPARARVVVFILLTVLVVGITALLVAGVVVFFRSEDASIAALLQKMAEIIERSRETLPPWLSDTLPADASNLKALIVDWLRGHAAEVQEMGGGIGRALAYSLIGMIVGGLIALRETGGEIETRPLSRALAQRAALAANSFRRVVLAQVRIAALNSTLVAIYLWLLLPAFGVHLPLTKTLIGLTFVLGMLPIIGNLISNCAIVVIGLSHSVPVALGSLVFLVVIHKLEYFVNARIVGSQINAAAWELLLAMLVMEAAFGLPGVVAAPVIYAYAKAELAARGLV